MRHDKEYLDAIIRNLMGDANACNALAKAATDRDANYFAQRIGPFLVAYEEELETVRGQRKTALANLEQLRQLLATIAANGLTDELRTRADLVSRARPGE